ncbi:glycine zipper family protein [uncultured Bacteroides sp.]|uniref:glycine zipper family protein n=1 Tax=uncultured Bacteroides sp. TaxID=162156 RepID=UPI002AA81D07|nr:glycine zipper family protein [uncultured Bacteroides sp.]
MRRQVVMLLLSTLFLSGCATGRMGDPDATFAGASIGGSLGNAVGGLIGENNNGWRGGYRGSAIGTIIGTIAGAAIGNALTTPQQEESVNNTYISDTHARQPVNLLRLRNIRFIDDSRNQAIDASENSKVIFEVMNEGQRPAYSVVPIVEQVSKIKNIGISPSVMIERILPGEGIRYTATVYAGNNLKEGEITLRVAVSDENGVICDSQEFTLPTYNRN